MPIYAVVGLGYVGLDLATALAKRSHVIGYDIDKKRIRELQQHEDSHHLVTKARLSARHNRYTNDIHDIKTATFYIVAVATPAYANHQPDLRPLKKVSMELAKVLKRGDIIVFESTVYPGTTEEFCIPILEKYSHLIHGKDFFVGYSPERINPGDKKHVLKNIAKIVACDDPTALKKIKSCYQKICNEVHIVSNIRTAEAIKLLENTQRDVNIAFMNEFAKIMHALDLNTDEVIKGAETKWSFSPYKPGFVGGHCIAVDPYYLAFQAKQHGTKPDLVLAARRINDGMTLFVVQSLLKCLMDLKMNKRHLHIGLFGITYKPNVSDIRNSLALKLIKELEAYDFQCHVHDPLYTSNLTPVPLEPFESMHDLNVAIIVVGHEFYAKVGIKKFMKLLKKPAIIMDIPSIFGDEKARHDPKVTYWSL